VTEQVDLVVVGAGITGLAAAWEASGRGATVTVVDPDAPGGKLRSSAFAGGSLDESADAFLARVPEGIELCRELGIDGDLVSPALRTAYVWSRGELRALPRGHVLGVPTDLDELAATGIVSPAGLERARADLTTPLEPPSGDPAIGSFIRERLGDEVLDRLVDPLVGGINAGDTDLLSLAATVPQLDAAARSGAPSLMEACARQAAGADPSAPVFHAPRGGMGSLVTALVEALGARGVIFQRDTVGGLQPDGTRWSVRPGDGGTGAAPAWHADRVVVTTPAPVSARLVGAVAPGAAALLAGIPMTSVVMVSLAVPRDAIDRELDASGYLVPRTEGRLLTACSWTSAKWAHLGQGDTVWLRASAGRDGDDRATALDDGPLVEAVLGDLAVTMALRGRPDEVRVTRWDASFPQYRPGHLDRVADIDADLAAAAPGLAVTGAAFRGLGVPACIRQGRAAARHLLG
jgi:protoporphyrinogen/coproporphyrinogen III oxidase